MSEAKHTPGPWSADWWYHEASGQGGWSFSAGGRRLPLCDMEMDPAKDDEPEANARLISAAPEILEALRLLMIEGPDLDEMSWADACDKARAAIAKATGEQA